MMLEETRSKNDKQSDAFTITTSEQRTATEELPWNDQQEEYHSEGKRARFLLA